MEDDWTRNVTRTPIINPTRVGEQSSNVFTSEYSEGVGEEGEGTYEEIETSDHEYHFDDGYQDIFDKINIDHVLDLDRSYVENKLLNFLSSKN